MILCIADVLGREKLDEVRRVLAKAEFHDGRETAGWHARLVKRNQQASAHDRAVASTQAAVHEAIVRHPLFDMAARPRRVKPVMFSRYEPGMEYGNHVDNAVMGAGDKAMRTDVSFTLFLSDPAGYDGGDLVTDTTAGEQTYKLPAGSLVLYPASTLHRVAPVTRGERLAAVGWAQSQVRDPAQREILFDLDTVRHRLFEREGKTEEFDLITKNVANLLRTWAEV